MNKVFIVHGFEGSPNGGWRPWLMSELAKIGIYACALAMPSPESPKCDEWVEEIERHVRMFPQDKIILVGHSLGVTAILRYLESSDTNSIIGAVLVSGPSEVRDNATLSNFFETPFLFDKILSNITQVSIIHGEDDTLVPLNDAQYLSEQLHAKLVIVPGGGHLNGSSGCYSLPECLEAIKEITLKQQ